VNRGQLAVLPAQEGRQAERRIVNLAARLRDPGARLAEIEVVNLSINGFLAHGDINLEVGSDVWLKLPGMEPKNGRVVWTEDGKAGCEFVTPLHPALLEQLSASARRGPPKRHFGPQAVRPS
jgi:hypothetical protein